MSKPERPDSELIEVCWEDAIGGYGPLEKDQTLETIYRWTCGYLTRIHDRYITVCSTIDHAGEDDADSIPRRMIEYVTIYRTGKDVTRRYRK